MANTTPRQLLLLADHLKLSLLERQRAISLKLDSSKQDTQISRSLIQLEAGIAVLANKSSADDENPTSDLSRLRKQYADLYSQFYNAAPLSAESTKPNDASLAEDFAAVQSRPAGAKRGNNRNVRFRDDPDAPEDPLEQANRAALFSDSGSTERYRDDPEPTLDQSQLDNQQIHEYHRQVIADQDSQLDVLSQSIGRQRMLGIQMGTELDEQNELLDDVERGVDRHSNTLERARKRLGHIARKSKANWSWMTIAILIIILVLLLVILK